MPYLRQAKRFFEKIRNLSYLFSQSGFTRYAAWSYKIELVIFIFIMKMDFQIINFTRPEGGRRISYTSTTDNTVKLFI